MQLLMQRSKSSTDNTKTNSLGVAKWKGGNKKKKVEKQLSFK